MPLPQYATQFLTDKFAAALPFADYVNTGAPDKQTRWHTAFAASKLTESQVKLLARFKRQMNVLVVSGVWCGDCASQGPLMERIAQANPEKITVRFVDRDLHKDLSSQLRINGAVRVPAALFMAEDFEHCSTFAERPLNRYRQLARKQLGESADVLIAPPNVDEQAATLQDWLNEFERIQLMLRISPRLRQKHGD